jgi:murein DD-endopeptidase MepM/ murein hydrolase activator NlpD
VRFDWIQADIRISQDWGCTDFTLEPKRPGVSCPHFHEGIDLANGRCNDRVVCVIPGTVVGIGTDGFGPAAVKLRIGDGHDIIFGHLNSTPLHSGQPVNPGDEIGRIGNRVGPGGTSTGCHLHFEVRPARGGYQTSINPAPWLDAHMPSIEAEWRAVVVPNRWEARAVVLGR